MRRGFLAISVVIAAVGGALACTGAVGETACKTDTDCGGANRCVAGKCFAPTPQSSTGAAGSSSGSSGANGSSGAASPGGSSSGNASSSSGGGSSGGSSSGATSGFVEAPHPALLQVPDNGGPLLSPVEVVTVTWAGDDLATGLQQFGAWVANSADYFGLVLPQYGVDVDAGTATDGVLPAFAGTTFDDSQVLGVLSGGIDAGLLPPPNAQTVYVLYPPAGVSVTQNGYAGCTGFQAYHGEVAGPGGAPLVYAMVPRCPAEASAAGMPLLDFTTWGASHEIAEASTDPLFPAGEPGWIALWTNVTDPYGGEIADLCEGYPMAIDGNEVTALYSNAAAAAGQRACVPAPTGPSFGAWAEPSAIAVAAGDAGTATAWVYSSAPIALTLSAYGDDVIAASPTGVASANGQSVPITITAPPGTSPGSTGHT